MKRAPLALLLLVLVAVAFGAWTLLRGGDPPASRTDMVRPGGPPAARPAADAAELAPTPTAAAPAARREEPAQAAGPDLDAGQSFDGDVRELEVVVALPAGSPPDETLAVYGFAVEDSDGDLDDARRAAESFMERDDLEDVDDDVAWVVRRLEGASRVRVPVPAAATHAAFVLRGRYVASEPQVLALGGAPEELSLEGRLGAWVTGRVLLPAGWEERELDLDDLEIDLASGEGEAMSVFFGGSSREARMSADRTFEFRAVPGETCALASRVDGLVDYREGAVRLTPGGNIQVEVAFLLGGAVRGRVLDEGGEPVAGASVRAGGALWFAGGNATKANDAGEYALYGLKPGKVSLTADADGFGTREVESFEIADAEVRAGLDIQLSRGAAVSGRVTWPDGRPAEGVRVRATQAGEGRQRFFGGDSERAESDAEGRFTLTGLRADTCTLVASITVDSDGQKLDVREAPSLANITDIDDLQVLAELGAANEEDGRRWTARDTVTAGEGGEVLLTLVPPGTIRGRVVDDTGAPVAAFEVSASPVREQNNWNFSGEAVAESFESEDGTFELEGPYAGPWTVTASAAGYGDMLEDVRVEVPQAEDVELVLSRGASIAGRVVDVNGAPIAEAEVLASTGRNDWRSRQTTTTDEEGEFLLEDVGARSWTLTASHADWAASEPIAVELLPGVPVADVVLALRIGGRITGEVYDDDGEPRVGQNVGWSLGGRGFDMRDTGTRTDAGGRFVLEHVTPGKVTVTAMPSQDELFSLMSESEDESGFVNVMGSMRTAAVEVADGGEAHVVLGGTPRSPVTVRGRVREAGAPLADVSVVVVAEGKSFIEGMKAAKTDAGGAFEVELDRPGAYVFNVNTEGLMGGGFGIEFYEDVPEASSHEVLLEMPLGRIAGRVLGPDGEPLPGVGLRVSNEGGSIGMGDFGQTTSSTSDAAGLFEFQHLRAGTYTVRAGTANSPFERGGPAGYGAAALSGIVVRENDAVLDLELRLRAAGTLEGVVRDTSGAPVADASVYARDEDGRLLSGLSAITTNPAGAFEYTELPGGQITVEARAEGLVTARPRAVAVPEGGTAEVELTLVAGGYLVVTAQLDGEPVRARIKATDDEGREVQGMLTMSDLQDLMTEGFSTKERRIGPVPPGQYEVTAVTSDGKTASRKVTVRPGQEERKVKLRLK